MFHHHLSLPSRKRGLKLRRIYPQHVSGRVASFAEAWIEILQMPLQSEALYGRFLRGSVDWNCHAKLTTLRIHVASFAEAWIEICWWLCKICSVNSRFLRGSVDWNPGKCAISGVEHGRFLRGSVDWNCQPVIRLRMEYQSLPSRKRGLK